MRPGLHMTNVSTLPTGISSAAVVQSMIMRAREAQKVAGRYSQPQLDELVAAVGWAIMEPSRNRALAEIAVRDTGLGDVADKIEKNHRKTLGLLRDLQAAVSTGVIAQH